MNPIEHGPAVLVVYCSAKTNARQLCEIRVRPQDGHRIMHATGWTKRHTPEMQAAIGMPEIDLDDAERAAILAEPVPAGSWHWRSAEAQAIVRRFAAGAQEHPWLFCACCGRNTSVTADWLREMSPRCLHPRGGPRRVAAPEE